MTFKICTVLALLVSISCAHAQDMKMSTVGEGFSKSSINTVVFRRYSLFTHAGVQYIAYYGPDSTMMLGKRKSGDDKWTTQATQYKGNTSDAHNSISLAVDGEGYLHVAFDHHNVPLRYARSVEPGSLELTDKMPMTGDSESKVTYPEFYPQADGGLLFLYRDGASGNGNLILNRYDLKTNKWSHVQSNLINGEGQRNAYWQAATDAKGTLHLSWVWRETGDVATNHDVCYAKSMDGGVTWTKSDGSAYQMPITQATAEIALTIPQKSDLINQTSMFADADGHPYIATYFCKPGGAAPQFHLIYNDGKIWKSSQVHDRKLDFHLAGGGTKRIPISRPLVLADSANGKTRAFLIFRDEERQSRVTISSCDDLTKQVWTTKDVTDFSVGQWEPTCDPTAWRDQKTISLFIQKVGQGDGEKLEDLPPTAVQVLDVMP